MFLSRGDRDLRFVYQTHPRSQASPCGEGKDSTLLSTRDGYVLESTEWPKGSQAYCGVWREDSGYIYIYNDNPVFLNFCHGLTCWTMYIGDPVRKGNDFLLLSFIVLPGLISPYCVLSLDFVCGPLSVFVIAHSFLIHKIISVLDTLLGFSWIGWMDLITLIESKH